MEAFSASRRGLGVAHAAAPAMTSCGGRREGSRPSRAASRRRGRARHLGSVSAEDDTASSRADRRGDASPPCRVSAAAGSSGQADRQSWARSAARLRFGARLPRCNEGERAAEVSAARTVRVQGRGRRSARAARVSRRSRPAEVMLDGVGWNSGERLDRRTERERRPRVRLDTAWTRRARSVCARPRAPRSGGGKGRCRGPRVVEDSCRS